MINGRTRLHVVANGTMTGQRYIDEVLLPHVRLFRGAVGDKFVFMDHNATCHRTLAVQDCPDSEVAGRNYPPTNKNTIIRTLTEEWDKLPQQLLDNVVQSMSSLDEATDPWGVKVERVEIKDVRLPVQLQRAMAAEAEAAREARAKVIAAEGEQRASRALKEAAEVIADSPSALQLRYLQTLNSIAAEKNSTIVFPLPMELFRGMQKAA
ncbi:mechanosensory protein 2 [Trichonephila clavipes]|nr:mechanosensory protein 2 [Trichonephila clavipes]